VIYIPRTAIALAKSFIEPSGSIGKFSRILEGLKQLPNGTGAEIIDANGRTIQKIRLNTDRQRIDTRTWNKGIYLVRIIDSKGGLLLTKKLIVQ